jgi:hypothetical protein
MIGLQKSCTAGTVFNRTNNSFKKICCLAGAAAMMAQLSLFTFASTANAAFTAGGWSYNRTVTINPTGTTTTVVNFPVLVRLNGKAANGGNASDSLVFATSMTNGYDIRFAQTGYTDSLPFEIERYDAANLYAEFWVLVPAVAAAGTPTTIKLFFGNPGVTGSPSNPAAIWNNGNGFSLVYHMNYGNPGAASGNAVDASTNGLNGTLTGTITQNAGTTGSAVGIGETFDGTSGYYSAPGNANSYPNFRYLWTVSGWFYLTGTYGGGVCVKGDGITGNFHSGNSAIYFNDGNGAKADGLCPIYSTSGMGQLYTNVPLSANAWHHVVWQYQGNGTTAIAQNMYVDGAQATGMTQTVAFNKAEANITNFSVGAANQNNGTHQFFNGSMDEFRVDSAYRSADWVKLCYQTQLPLSAGTSAVSLSSFTLSPLPPTLVSPANNTGSLADSGITVTWSSTAGSAAVSSYAVQVSTDAAFASTVASFGGLTATSQLLPTLSSGTLYYWRANATGTGGAGNWSAAWNFSTITSFGAPPLAIPVNGAANQPVSVNLNWIGVTGAVSYTLQVSTVPGFTNTVFSQGGISGTTQNVKLANAVTYYWQANAFNGTVTTAWSGVWSFSTTVAVPALSMPTNGALAQPAALTLAWGTVAGATSYGVMVSANSGFTTTLFGQTGLTSPTVAVSGLSNAQVYYWSVNAANAGGAGAWSTAWSFTTVMAVAGVPQLVSPASGNAGLTIPVGLSWQSAVGATTYELEVGTSGNFGAGSTVFDQTGITGTADSLSGLLAAHTYYWQVRAINNAGPGMWSQVWNFITYGSGILKNAVAGLKTEFSVKGETIAYSLHTPGVVEMTFSDLLGRTAFTMKRSLSAGHYALSLRECSLAEGRYIVRFKTAGFDKNAVVMVTR